MTKGAEVLKRIREKKGYTQEDVSEFTGIPRGTIACIEADENYETSPKTAKILAEFLDIDWTYFFEKGE